MTERYQQFNEHVQPRLFAPALTRAAVPPAPQRGAVNEPWLYTAILGNGRLLACLDATGGIAQLFYPTIDAGPHVRALLMGIQTSDDSGVTTPISWLIDAAWSHHLRYLDHTPALEVISTNATLGWRVTRRIAAHPTQDALITEGLVTNLQGISITCNLVVYAGIDIDYRRSGTTCHFDKAHATLNFFADDRYLAFACDAPVERFACDQMTVGGPDAIFASINANDFNGEDFTIGQVSGAARYHIAAVDGAPASPWHLYLACARSLDDVTTLATDLIATPPAIAQIVAAWRAIQAHTPIAMASPAVRDLYAQSLMVLRQLTDSATGAIIAAPEMDPDFRSCGGYGYCWPRDGAFNANALDVAGQHAQARAFYDWALRVQAPSGVWYQRYRVTGALAPTWGLVQFDETGAIVWAICRHIQLTGDLNYGREVLPHLIRAGEYMVGALDAATGLAPITKDLWEESDAISTYACACTWGGFHELALLAARLDEHAAAQRWEHAAAALKDAITTHLWDAKRGRFLRGLQLRLNEGDVARRRNQPDFDVNELSITEEMGRTWYILPHDATIDTAILGLSVPFGVFAPDDPRIVATADAIYTQLSSPIGGIGRYAGDLYRGGNPWIICTLWLAWQDLAAGHTVRARELFDWSVAQRTALDLLPEQIDQTTSEPTWIVPLGWSHAMLLLVAQAMVAHEH